MVSHKCIFNFISGKNTKRPLKEAKNMNSRWIDYTALTLVIVGAINWGLIGFFRFDLVAFLFGNMTWISRTVYGLVGLSGLYLISLYGRIGSSMD